MEGQMKKGKKKETKKNKRKQKLNDTPAHSLIGCNIIYGLDYWNTVSAGSAT